MADSRRINANIREEDEKRPVEEQPPFGVYAVILSGEFWPPFKDEKLEVPEDIREALEVYCKKYEKLKVRATPPSGGRWGLHPDLATLPSRLCNGTWVRPTCAALCRHPSRASASGQEGAAPVLLPSSLRSLCTCACTPTLGEGPGRFCPLPHRVAPPSRASSSTVCSLTSRNWGLGHRACPRESQGAVCAPWASASKKSPDCSRSI